ncbi:MAG: preprotein translocase subunit YajC [Muribaculaceae bacterium]|nr:preprotein translocase subunit YajC [Muribaculaceae bacterium]
MITNLIPLQAAAGGTDYYGIIMIVGLILVFYFLMIRPQQKKQKEIRKFREGLKKGDNIITAGGIHGKIKEIKEDSFLVSVSDNTVLRIDKGSVYPSAADAQEQEANKTKA